MRTESEMMAVVSRQSPQQADWSPGLFLTSQNHDVFSIFRVPALSSRLGDFLEDLVSPASCKPPLHSNRSLFPH